MKLDIACSYGSVPLLQWPTVFAGYCCRGPLAIYRSSVLHFDHIRIIDNNRSASGGFCCVGLDLVRSGVSLCD